MTTSRRNFLIASAVVSGGSFALSACSSGNAGGPAGASPSAGNEKAASEIAIGTKADSAGPAPEVAGAVKGGTVNVLDRDDFTHLDPQRIYLNYYSGVSNLFTRTLTAFKNTPSGLKLVGDLATDTGTTTDGGKTWTFTLKDGVKWQDGKAVTSDDIKWSFERAFADFITEGPTYAQSWLTGTTDYRKVYSGPYSGKRLAAIEAPDAKTVVFKLKEAHTDFNFTVSMTGYGAVPRAHDTKAKYDKQPQSSGPYLITSHVTDKSMTLARNPHWDPATDPIRHAYPDAWQFSFGYQALQSTDRFIADSGTDKTALALFNPVAPERMQQVLGDPALMKRTVQGIEPFTDFYAINTTRITDTKVRQALNYAFPLQQIREIEGGPMVGDYATTVLSPTVSGYQKYDLYGKLKNPEGNPVTAKKLLKETGKLGQKIVYAYPQTDIQEKVTVAIKAGLEKAGFEVVTKALPSATYYDATGKVANPYDLYWAGWSADWPTGYTAIQPIFDGRVIADGASNWSHLNSPSVNKAIDAAAKITDPSKAAAAWAALDKAIMEQAPIVPEFYARFFSIYGSGLGGVEFDPIMGLTSLLSVYIKK